MDEEESIIQIAMLAQKEEEEEYRLSDNLVNWKIVSISPTLIEIDLEFSEPLKVS